MSRPTVPAPAVPELVESPPWAGSFLSRLPKEARSHLLDGGAIHDVAAGRVVAGQSALNERTWVLMAGLASASLQGPNGRRIVVRYVQPGGLVGVVPGVPPLRHHIHVEAVGDCSLVELPTNELARLAQVDPRVAAAVLADVSGRLQDTYATLAVTAFGTMRERVAMCLLGLALRTPDGRLAAPVTQQGLADAVGTVRQEVARVLADLRQLGLVATGVGEVVIQDGIGLAAIVERWI